MILSDAQIKAAVDAHEITIEPFDEEQLQPASYDLRVGDHGATTTAKAKVDIAERGYIEVAPGDFAVVTTYEIIKLTSRYAGRLGLRSKFARKGLIATTGPQIDPGFRGRLIVGVTNPTPSPVVLAHKEGFLTVELHRLEQAATKPYSGPYQDRYELGPEELSFILEREAMTLSEVLRTLNSVSASVAALTRDVGALKWAIPILLTIGMGVIAVIVGLR